jgi:DoxX-like family
MTANRIFGVLRLVVLVALTLLLCAFHGFVGWHKAFSTHEELVQHAAWTMHLPMWLGKTVGWVEMAVTAALLVAMARPRLARTGLWACIAFIVMELAASVTHYVTQDGGSLVQNAVTITLTAVLAWLYAGRPPEKN